MAGWDLKRHVLSIFFLFCTSHQCHESIHCSVNVLRSDHHHHHRQYYQCHYQKLGSFRDVVCRALIGLTQVFLEQFQELWVDRTEINTPSCSCIVKILLVLLTFFVFIDVIIFHVSITDEMSSLSERLREKGVDMETERKLEQVCTHVWWTAWLWLLC